MSDCLAALGPGVGCDVLDLPVGQRRQAGEDLTQVGLRVDSSSATGFDDRAEDSATLSGLGYADEQPVLLADASWPDDILDWVAVDLLRYTHPSGSLRLAISASLRFHVAILDINEQHGPLRQGIVDGFAHGALR